MIDFLVDMHIFGHGDALAIVKARTITEAHETVNATAEKNEVEVTVNEIMPWNDFVMQDMGFDLLSRR